MFIGILFIIITFIFFLKSKFPSENEEIFIALTYIIGITTAIGFFLLFFRNNPLQSDFYYLLFIPFFIFGIYYINKKTKPKSLEIIANNQRYFKEVKAKDIINFYKIRKNIKKDRIEVLVNEDSKKIIINNKIVPSFFLNLKSFQPTEIKTINDLNESIIFKVIFEKIKEFIIASEAKEDFEKILKNNDFKAEYLLMDLWEKYTFKFNISLANLEVIAKNQNELELIGALDLINLNSIKPKGAILFYKYMEFKDRIKDYIKNENSINPTEKEFDEEYAK